MTHLFFAWFVLAIILAAPAVRSQSVTSLAFSPDGKSLVVGAGRLVRSWQVPEGKPLQSIPIDFAKIASVKFDASGKFLAVAGGHPGIDGSAAILSWPAGELLATAGNHSDLVTSADFDSTGTRLIVAGADRHAEVFSWPENRQLFQLEGHSGPILGAAFSPDGKQIVTASADRSVKVWNATDGSLKYSFSQHTEIVHGLAFRPRVGADASLPFYCATASEDRTVRVWQPSIGRMVRIVRAHEAPVFTVAYSPDGAKLFSAGKEGIIRVIDGDSDTIFFQWKAHDDWIYALAISRDGLIGSADWTGAVRVWNWNAEKANLLWELPGS